MHTIKNNLENEIIINKSRFICNLIKIVDENDAKEKLNDIKNKYKDATHNCYAYIINNTKRFSDDGEPSGTAGMPILSVLEKNDLNHVLCTVTRYFGGTKLGAGGLIRAYTNSVSETLNKLTIIKEIEYEDFTITFDYSLEETINNFFKDYQIVKKVFTDTIEYTVLIPLNEFDDIVEKLHNILRNN